MRLSQIVDDSGKRALVVTARGESRLVRSVRTTLALAGRAIEAGLSFRKLVADLGLGKPVDLARALKEKRVLAPIDTPIPRMSSSPAPGSRISAPPRGATKCTSDLADPAKLTNSMKMFGSASRAASRRGAKRACSRNGSTKATARSSSAPEGDLHRPAFALDGGEEPEIVGVYLIDGAGPPVRLGFALGNEFSDHVMERQNYLCLAHSKLQAREPRAGAAHRRSAAPRRGRVAHPPRQGDRLGEAVPVGRAEHGARDRQPRGAPLQVWALSPAGARPRAFLRHGDAVLLRRVPGGKGRRVRDRVGAVRPAAAQQAAGRQGEGGGCKGALSAGPSKAGFEISMGYGARRNPDSRLFKGLRRQSQQGLSPARARLRGRTWRLLLSGS